MLGVTDDFTLTAEYGALGLRVMNDMLTEWAQNSVDVGYFEQDTLTDDTPVEAEHRLAVKSNLAVNLAPYFSREPSPALLSIASRAYRNLLRCAQDAKLEPVTTESAPLGENWGGRYNIFTDT